MSSKSSGAQIILVNAYHLYLRPGAEVVEALGGVHSFISWQKPILSDSGGFQIYSMSPLVKVRRTESGSPHTSTGRRSS